MQCEGHVGKFVTSRRKRLGAQIPPRDDLASADDYTRSERFGALERTSLQEPKLVCLPQYAESIANPSAPANTVCTTFSSITSHYWCVSAPERFRCQNYDLKWRLVPNRGSQRHQWFC